jgi:hypothetical protein
MTRPPEPGQNRPHPKLLAELCAADRLDLYRSTLGSSPKGGIAGKE